MIRHMVEYFYPGSFFEEKSCQEVERRDTALVDPPSSSFAFRFYDTEYEMATTDSGNRVEVNHRRVNTSGRYYIEGTVYTTEQLEDWADKQEGGRERYEILISNCRNNGGRVVRSRLGNWQEFDENAQLWTMS